MFEQSIEPGARKQLAVLEKTGFIKHAYLAGGTAIALQIGHRISFDLDFFTEAEYKREEVLLELNKLNFKLEEESWGTIQGLIGDTKFSLFVYEYPMIGKTLKYQDINVASLEDLVAMKVSTISSRGTKRDFVDLYYLRNKFTLTEMIGFYDKKFQNLETNKTHILKSLVYFSDADVDLEPNMLVADYSWENVKEYFIKEVQNLAMLRDISD